MTQSGDSASSPKFGTSFALAYARNSTRSIATALSTPIDAELFERAASRSSRSSAEKPAPT